MRVIKLTLAYDGTDFHGWQVQPGKPTIQGAVNDVLRRLTQEHITVHGAGRTDAGVHAEGQVAHFKTLSEMGAREFQRALNALLPPAIRVVGAEEAERNFHARHQAVVKTYCYRIYRGAIVPPFLWRYVLHYPYPLDEGAMCRAARVFEGEHDFTSFSAPEAEDAQGGEEVKRPSPVKTILESGFDVARREAEANGAQGGYELVYTVRGRSFLRYMVRKVVGTLLEVGRGRMSEQDIVALFELRDRSKSGPTVPPHGLTMKRVEYE
jgi:tRNA pseudouridine38-40 synthase